VIVLGIDPGTASLGYGIVERIGGTVRALDFGVFSTTPADPLPVRLDAIHQAVGDLIATHRPALVAVERLFFSRNAQTAFAVGQARGVVLLAAAQAGIEVREATPNEVKSAIAGYGAADKAQVQRMVQLVLGMAELPTPDDAADALAIAVGGANTAGSATGRQRTGADAAVMDRAAIAPIDRGLSSYERAVREALVREKAAEREAKRAAKRSAS
jgi:crossover junction endodeoxyribonuclease RuvC